jgi:3-hydroxyisobutyrate dehydrogenase/glyoxylate/succinic semialdehyde reductase
MAKLVQAAHDGTFIVHNRSKDKAAPLLEAGAEWRDTPRAVGEAADIIVTMLSDPAAVEAVVEGPAGLLAGMQAGMQKDALWVDCTTVNPSFTRRMGRRADEAGVRFVDAPVAGSTVPAEKGELVVYVGGSGDDVLRARPVIEPFAKAIHHMGGRGMGSSMKMVNNTFLGYAMAGFSEALRLGQAMGLDESAMQDILVGGPLVPAFMSAKKPRLDAHDYSPQFPLRLMYKDLALACHSAYELDTPVDVLAAVTQRFAAAQQAGLGDQDFSAIYRFMNGRSGQ